MKTETGCVNTLGMRLDFTITGLRGFPLSLRSKLVKREACEHWLSERFLNISGVRSERLGETGSEWCCFSLGGESRGWASMSLRNVLRSSCCSEVQVESSACCCFSCSRS